ncbi:amino acid adenylation domain-containing protein [Actinophytocola sediminis]
MTSAPSDLRRPTEPALGGAAGGVHELVAAQAAARPDAPAVSCGQTVLSYRDLDDRAGRLAARLVRAGTRPGEVVAVFAGRSVELVVALLAVLKTGAAYLAIDQDAPATMADRQLRDARVRVAVAEEAWRERVPAALRVVDPSGDDPRDEAGDPAPVHRTHPDDLAYLSYTSGTTGEPKGVAVPHRAVLRLVAEAAWAGFTERDVFLQLAPVAFDAATLELWAPLVRGARLAVFPPGPVLADEVARVLAAEEVSVLWLTAGLFHRMVDTRLDQLGGLRHLLAGGDVLSPAHVAKLLDRHPDLVFTNGYGPTENTTFTTCWTSRTPPDPGPVPIGTPIDHTTVAILDAALRPVPAGAVGELYAAGSGLARGYLHRPAATAHRFVADPLASTPGARMYRTGDLARWLPDGAVEFVGRADDQVKLLGFRVEPGAVRAAVARCAGVRDAVVVLDRAPAGPRLVAYVVAETVDEHATLAESVLRQLRAELPQHAVPWQVVALTELPLTGNGKVDRSALPPASRAPRTAAGEYVAPHGELQTRLAESWCALLGIEAVGVDDDFFELGGHSLIAAELLDGIERDFAVPLPARTLYLSPTVAELAEVLGEAIRSPDDSGSELA